MGNSRLDHHLLPALPSTVRRLSARKPTQVEAEEMQQKCIDYIRMNQVQRLSHSGLQVVFIFVSSVNSRDLFPVRIPSRRPGQVRMLPAALHFDASVELD